MFALVDLARKFGKVAALLLYGHAGALAPTLGSEERFRKRHATLITAPLSCRVS